MRASGRFVTRVCLALGVSILCGCASLQKAVRDFRTRAKVGVLANLEIEWENSTQPLRRALAYFAHEQVDAVILIDKLTRTGHPRQMEALMKAWQDAFEGVRVPQLLLVTDQPQTMTLDGVTFGASARKHYGAWKSAQQPALSFYSGMKPALTDEICFLSPASRAICAGSMRGVFVPSIYEPVPEAAKAAQGLLVTVLGDTIEVKRMDFTGKTPVEVASPWEVWIASSPPAPRNDDSNPSSDSASSAVIARSETTKQSTASPTPQFAPGAKVEVVYGYIKPKGSAYATEAALTVRWPTALSRFGGVRAAYYELTVAGTTYQKRFLSPNFYLSEAQDLAPLSTVIPLADLDAALTTVRVEVTAVSASGKRSKILTSTPLRVK